MNDQKILNMVADTVTAAARPDFADLLARIRADNGASTAPQMTPQRSGAGKVFAYAAAGIAAAAALGTMTFVGLSMGSVSSSESFAPDAECEAPMASESFSEDIGYENILDSAAPSEPTMNDSMDNDMWSEDENVSDGDVSGSDVSGTDAQEVE
ncbi:MAG: hypothetical protein E7554_02555 [Ruminococcaceae bacterium]|nr:hypothetical protein [Oscillospiraceae bacterium]